MAVYSATVDTTLLADKLYTFSVVAIDASPNLNVTIAPGVQATVQNTAAYVGGHIVIDDSSLIAPFIQSRMTANIDVMLGGTGTPFTLNPPPPPTPNPPVIATTTIVDGTVGTAYSAPLAVTGGTGVAPLVWSATGLPPGLAITPATGTIFGTPTTAGGYSVVARVVDRNGDADQHTYAVTIAAYIDPPVIDTATLPDGTVSSAYAAPLAASGGALPLAWSATGLPPGLTINASTGTVSGMPTVAAAYTIVVTVTDALSRTATASYGVTIAPVIAPPPPPPPHTGRSTYVPPFTGTELLDIVPGVGRVGYTYDFELFDRNGTSLGRVHPMEDKAPTIDVSTDRAMMRTCHGLQLAADDINAINPLTDLMQVWMRLETGDRWPLGRFMFGDYIGMPRGRSAGGLLSSVQYERAVNCFDRTFALEQPIERAVALRPGDNVETLLRILAHEVGISDDDIIIMGMGATVGAPMAWPAGTVRYEIMKVIAAMLACYPPHFDAVGRLLCRPVPDLTAVSPDHVYNLGGRIIADTIALADDSYKAPNRYIVTGGSATSAVSAYFDVPSDAPHSIANRGFVVAEVLNISGVASTSAALAAAIAAYVKDTRSFSVAEWDTTPDPRHGIYDVIEFENNIYLETGWSLPLAHGSKMHHKASRVWGVGSLPG